MPIFDPIPKIKIVTGSRSSTATESTQWSSPTKNWSDSGVFWGAGDSVDGGVFPTFSGKITVGALSTYRTSTTYNSPTTAYSSSSQIYGGVSGFEESRKIDIEEVGDITPKFA